MLWRIILKSGADIEIDGPANTADTFDALLRQTAGMDMGRSTRVFKDVDGRVATTIVMGEIAAITQGESFGDGAADEPVPSSLQGSRV